MNKKKIHVDPNFLSFNSKSKRRLNKIKKKIPNHKKTNKNTKDLCKHFLENIKSNQSIKPNTTNKSNLLNTSDTLENSNKTSFNDSLNFFNSITKLNKTKKNKQPILNSNSKINISFPETNIASTSNKSTNNLPPIKLKDPPPYGCLKNSNIPTYRQWVKTQKNKPSISTLKPTISIPKPTISTPKPIISTPKSVAKSVNTPICTVSTPTSIAKSVNTPITTVSNIPCNITTPPELKPLPKPKPKSCDIITIPLNPNKNLSNKNMYSKGECVLYKNNENIFEKATIIDIHMDSLKPYYTIKLHNSNTERQTEPGRLCYEKNLDLDNQNKIFIKKNIRTVRHKLGKRNNKIGILIKDKKRRETIRNMKGNMGKEALRSVKKYLRDKNLIKIGSKAPNDVLRTIYQDSKLAGDINNTGKGILMHNYLNNDNDENDEISLEA